MNRAALAPPLRILKVNDILTNQNWHVFTENLFACPAHHYKQLHQPGICDTCGKELELALHTDLENEHRDMTIRWLVAIIFTIPLLLIDFESILGFTTFIDALKKEGKNIFEFVLVLPVLIWGTKPFLKYLFVRPFSGEFLISISILFSFIYSTLVTFAPNLFQQSSVYFSATATITSVSLLFKMIESRTHLKTLQNIQKIWNLIPPLTHQVFPNGAVEDLPIQLLTTGHVVMVKQQERIPADGVLLSVDAEVNESDLTGGQKKTKKIKGDKLIGGTFNLGNDFTMRVEKTGDQTLAFNIPLIYAKAHRLIIEFQSCNSKLIQKMVLFIISVSFLTLIFYYFTKPLLAAPIALSLLMVSSPYLCNIATSFPLLFFMSKAAQKGTLFHHTDALLLVSQLDEAQFSPVQLQDLKNTDITFINRTPQKLRWAKKMSQSAKLLIQKKMIFIIYYHLLAIPLAAIGVIPHPIFAALMVVVCVLLISAISYWALLRFSNHYGRFQIDPNES